MLSDALSTTLVGAAIGAVVAIAIYLAQRQQTRWAVTTAMINEFHGPAMISARANAHRYLIGKYHLKYDSIEAEFIDASDVSAKNDLWLVLSFYERLSILIDAKAVVTGTAGDIFGETFLWWWGYSFKDQLPEEWSASRHTRALYDWMSMHYVGRNQGSSVGYWQRRGCDARITRPAE